MLDSGFLPHQALLTVGSLPAFLLNCEEKAGFADCSRVKQGDLDTEVESAIASKELYSRRNFLVLDLNDPSQVRNRVNRLVSYDSFFLEVAVLIVTLVKFHGRQVEEERAEVQIGDQV